MSFDLVILIGRRTLDKAPQKSAFWQTLKAVIADLVVWYNTEQQSRKSYNANRSISSLNIDMIIIEIRDLLTLYIRIDSFGEQDRVCETLDI